MAPAATAPVRRAQPTVRPARTPSRRPPLRVVEKRRRPPAPRRRVALALSVVLVVVSLLTAAAAHALLTQGQVRLARLQQQLTNEEARHRDLELRVAQLEDPSNVVAKAEQQGLSAPAQVTDLPLVPGGSTSTATAGGTR